MQIREVVRNKDEWDFIKFPVWLYKDSEYWVRPLDNDIKAVFDPKKNKLFRNKRAKCKRWILSDRRGKSIGRIAAFINPKTAFKGKWRAGGIGFFECVKNQQAANILFDTAKNWLYSNDMEAMDGPVNFGERNAFWGLLVDGFDEEPVYQMNYNFPYYRELFENYGFKIYFKQFSYGLGVHDPRPEKYIKRAVKINEDPDYHFRHVDKKRLDKYADDFYEIYNAAWGNNKGVPVLTKAQAHSMMRKMKPVIVDYMMWFGYYKDKPIAMFINLPELNQYFKHVNGKLNLWGKTRILYHKLAKTNHKFYGLVFGVIPEFQAKGVESAIIMAANEVVSQKKQWEFMELTWIGDFNPKMMRIAENLGSRIIKTHYTYRYLFDSQAEFERHPIL